jgi:CheY-like chemotaxis protein
MQKLMIFFPIKVNDIDVMNSNCAFKNTSVYPLFLAMDGFEAFTSWNGNGVDLIDPMPKINFLAVNMPKMGGIGFLRVRRADAHLAGFSGFIKTTLNKGREQGEAYKLNVAGCMPKSLGMHQFISSESLLNNHWQLIEFSQSS